MNNIFQARKQLLDHGDAYDQKNTQELFLAAMREVMRHHADNNAFYRALLQKHGVLLQDIQTQDDLVKIPPVHANFFKMYEFLSVPRKAIYEHVTSSGTSGQKSQMFFDRDSWDFGQGMIKAEFAYFGFLSEEKNNYMLYTYQPTQNSKLGTAKTDEGLLQYAPVNYVFYALRYNGHGHDFDVYGVIDTFYLSSGGGKVRNVVDLRNV